MKTELVRELLYLWEGVYPYLADFVLELYGRGGGDFLEVGPFSGGVAKELARRSPSLRGAISGLEGELLEVVKGYLEGELAEGRLLAIPSSLCPLPFLDESFDLVFVRGAFFFLSPELLREVERVLAPGGLGVLGGGYGPSTPEGVISRIAGPSRRLNQALGRRRISTQELEGEARRAGLKRWEIREEGGLWLLVRKGEGRDYIGLAEGLDLGAQEVVALVGGGGKTTLMFSLARELQRRGARVITTTTTKIFEPPPWQTSCLILQEQGEGLLRRVEEGLKRWGHVTVARGRLPAEGKLLGIGPEMVGQLSELADYVIVEADGSKGRPLKAPAPHEPVVPGATTLFVVVVGADGLGRPLSEEWVFRSELAARLLGAREGDFLPSDAVAELILHPQGLMKGRPPGARALVFVNKVETSDRLKGARELAGGLACRGMKVVLGRAFFNRGVVEVFEGATSGRLR